MVLLEKNPIFWSCPLSNKWLVDVVDTSFLVLSYTAAAERMASRLSEQALGIRNHHRAHNAVQAHA